jgi:hypothetical protein
LVDQYGIKLDGFPRSYALVPVKEDFYKSSKTVGFVVGELNWTTFFHNVLPKEVQGIVVEVKGTCGAYFSFEIMGTDSKFLGHGEHHRAQYDSLKHAVEFAKDEVPVNDTDACRYTLTLLPTEEFEATYHTNKPAVYTTVVVMTFFFTAMTFALYDYAIVRRQRRLLAKAKRTTAIVSSMFPKEVQKRILEEAEAMEEEERKRPWKGRNAAKQQLKSFLNDDVVEGAPQGIPQTKPIADLYVHMCTGYTTSIVSKSLTHPCAAKHPLGLRTRRSPSWTLWASQLTHRREILARSSPYWRPSFTASTALQSSDESSR